MVRSEWSMSKKYEYNDAFNQCVEYFGGDDLAANVFLTKYALTDKEGKPIPLSANCT